MKLQPLPRRRRIEEQVARGVLLAASSLGVFMLGWLLIRTAQIGLPHLDFQFLTSFPDPDPQMAGILPAMVGTLWLALLTLVLTLPVGVLAGIYLNEYAKPTRMTRLIRLSISNLAGVPSVVFGLLGLAIFVRLFGLGTILLAGALTLAILTLPIIIVSTEEALKAVPPSIREAAYGLGATRWQVVKDHVLPYSGAGILTGSILALARAAGETAPLILVGGATAIFFVPSGPFDLYSALPLQAFYWASVPSAEFRERAATATVVLLGIILLANLAAILLRNRFQKRIRW